MTTPAQPADGAQVSPSNCRERLRAEGKPYPRSGCSVCKIGGLTGCPYERAVHTPAPQPEGGRDEAVGWADLPWRAATGWLRSASGSKIAEVGQGAHCISQRESELIAAAVNAYATATAAARVRDAWLPIESAPQDGTLGPIGESPKTIADEMEAWSEKKMSANGSSRIDRTLVREWAKRLRGEE